MSTVRAQYALSTIKAVCQRTAAKKCETVAARREAEFAKRILKLVTAAEEAIETTPAPEGGWTAEAVRVGAPRFPLSINGALVQGCINPHDREGKFGSVMMMIGGRWVPLGHIEWTWEAAANRLNSGKPLEC